MFALPASAQGPTADTQRLPADKFADVVLKLLSPDVSPHVAITRRPLDIVVLALPIDYEYATELVSAFERGRPYVDLKARSVTVKKCASSVFRSAVGNSTVIIAVKFSRDCAQELAKVSREKKILTIATSTEPVDPLSIAIVATGTQVQIYRSDYALDQERAKLSSDVIALTRSVSSVDYLDNFREAVRALDFQKWDDAIRRLNTAIEQRPDEGTQRVLIYGMRTEQYLPHYHLGVALYKKSGKCTPAARSEWEKSDSQRAIRSSSSYYTSLQRYLLTICPAPVADSRFLEKY